MNYESFLLIFSSIENILEIKFPTLVILKEDIKKIKKQNTKKFYLREKQHVIQLRKLFDIIFQYEDSL